MIMTIERPASHGLRVYEAIKAFTINASELQKLVFGRAVAALTRIRQTGMRDLRAFHATLVDNRRLWTQVVAQAALNPKVSPAQARELAAIAQFVFRHTHLVIARRADLAPLIAINMEMKEGRRGIVLTTPSCNTPPLGDV